MRKAINLFYLADPRYGGWPVFSQHLVAALKSQNYLVQLIKIGNTTEGKLRPYGAGAFYQNLDYRAARLLASSSPRNIITAVGPKYRAQAFELMKSGAKIVIHDPTEMHESVVDYLKANKVNPIVQRQSNFAILKKAGIEPILIRQPFVPVELGKVERQRNAVAFSRLDWDKLTHIIVEANTKLPAAKQTVIFGAENRLYTHHKMDEAFPGWRRYYKGQFPFSSHRPSETAVQLAQTAHYVVDLSAIKGDGGDQQMTFLEAWNAGCVLVVNKKWCEGNFKDPVVRVGYNALAVADAAELVTVLKSDPSNYKKLIVNGRKTLDQYAPKLIVSQWEKLFRE